MSYGSEFIGQIVEEIETEYLGGCIAWCDEYYDNAWTKAIDRFDLSLTELIENPDDKKLKLEGDIFLKRVKWLVKQFRIQFDMTETDAFVNSINESMKEKKEVKEKIKQKQKPKTLAEMKKDPELNSFFTQEFWDFK